MTYSNDLEYLQEELGWIEARTARIAAEFAVDLAGDDPGLGRRTRPDRDDPSKDELLSRVTRSQRLELERRDRIDTRLVEQRASGKTLALDRLCELHGLDGFERNVLLLATAPCFSRKFDALYSGLDREELSSNLTVEAIFSFAELTMAQRISRRRTFSQRGVLAANDLISVESFNALLFFDECEVIFSSRRHGNTLITQLLTELERFEGVAVLATNLVSVLDEALDRRILVKVCFTEPDRAARREIWTKHLPAAAPLADDVNVDLLADRYELTGGYIKNAILMAVADAVHSGGDSPAITMQQLDRAAQEQTVRPSDDNSPLVVPKVRLDDVAPPAALRGDVLELIAAARARRTVLERWGIGSHLTYGKGVSALLHGASGTGKTLCAEAVAGELSRPLMTASIPALVSKWVGETEGNLEGLFQRAKTQRAVLFLDERDSLLMERGGGRASRHDDSAVNVLLKLIERSEGVTLLATNLPDRLDRALLRRLDWKLAFPFPDREARAAVWRRLLPSTVPTVGRLDFDGLARFELAGGDIKNAVFKAAFRAASADRSLSQEDLETAAKQELTSRWGKRSGPIGFAASGCQARS